MKKILSIILASAFSTFAFAQATNEPTQQTWTEEYEDHQIIENEHRQQAADASEQDQEPIPEDDLLLMEEFENVETPEE